VLPWPFNPVNCRELSDESSRLETNFNLHFDTAWFCAARQRGIWRPHKRLTQAGWQKTEKRRGAMTFSAREAAAIIAEIEKSTSSQVKKMRSHERIAVRAEVHAQPANTSDRRRFETQGVLGDISQSGCLALFSDPLRVGDIYQLSFDRSTLDVEPLFARCLRCRMVREDSFEAGFRFFQVVDLAALEQPKNEAVH
jgi:hypothetical protein